MPRSREEALALDTASYEQEYLRQAVLSYPPRWATIGIISRCTNRCTFCSYHSIDARGGKSNVYNLKFSMPLERFKAQVDFFHAGRVPHVHICATGEPFLHPDIMDMIDHVISRYGKASFQSNFNRRMMERGDYMAKILARRENIAYVVTDVHAGEAGVYDAIKRGSSFTDVLTTLKTFSDAGIRIIGSCIVTRKSHASLPGLMEVLGARGIRLQLNIFNLFPHMFNEFTSLENVYHLDDADIAASLEKARVIAANAGITLQLPQAFGDPTARCSVFWDKVQVWPVKGIDPARYDENLIPHACNAVVLGELNSLGYISDYASVMDFWNNDTMIGLRGKVLAGEYPDKQCWSCPCSVALKPAP